MNTPAAPIRDGFEVVINFEERNAFEVALGNSKAERIAAAERR
ncbi:MAG: hypothetical protein ACRDS0_28955 [Pseudonocardiaceae bacterium]